MEKFARKGINWKWLADRAIVGYFEVQTIMVKYGSDWPDSSGEV